MDNQEFYKTKIEPLLRQVGDLCAEQRLPFMGIVEVDSKTGAHSGVHCSPAPMSKTFHLAATAFDYQGSTEFVKEYPARLEEDIRKGYVTK